MNRTAVGTRPSAWLRCLLLLALLPTASAADVLLYLPYADSALDATAALAQDPAFADRQVAVVGKYRLFTRAVQQDGPAVVFAPSTIDDLPGYRLIGQGQRAASTSDLLAWVSADPQQTAERLPDMQVGLLQTMERERAKTFLASAFPNLASPAGLRLTAKSEDVFNLLGLEMVQACILPVEEIERIEQRLSIRLQRLAISVPILLPRLWVKDGLAADAVLEAWSRLSPVSRALIGIDTVIAASPPSGHAWLGDPQHPEGEP